MYFITCLENLEKDMLGWLGDTRCFGYFISYERAKEALERNECDVWKMGIFEYAVIEKVEPGIPPHVEEIAWFKFDSNRKRFYEIEKPEETEGECNYALG